MKVTLLIICIIFLLAFVPLVVIWALNTLFLLTIPYGFYTWLSVIILCGVIRGSSESSSS